MTTLLTADGRTLKRSGPAGTDLLAQGSWFRPLWSSGTQDDAFGDHGAGRRMVSYAEIYTSQPAVAAAVNKLARQISTLPLKVYRRKANNDRDRVLKHPLVDLLNQPVERAGPVQFKQWIAMPWLVQGNALLAKFRKEPDGPPTSILPVDWRYVEAWARQGGPVEWWATEQFGEKRWLKVEDSLHFAWESPAGIVGTSPLEQLGVTLRNDDAIQTHTTASFNNGARPSSALVPPEGYRFKDGEKDEIREDIRQRYTGANAFNVALLGGGFDWKTLSHTAVEAQLIQQRQLHREEVNAVYDVAGPVVGDLTHGTYSNVTELYRQFYLTSVRPLLVLIEESLHAQLIAPEDEWKDLFVEFDMGEVLRGSKAEEIAAAVQAFTNGIETLNEVRRHLNLPPVDDPEADKPQIPANNLQALGANADPTIPPQGSPGSSGADPRTPGKN